MTIQIPSVDKHSIEELFIEFLKRVPFYLPEWNPGRENDSGAALARIFFEMFDKVRMRLNMMPEKSLVAFLDSLGFDLLPAQAAKTWVSFTAIPEAPANAIVRSGCELAGRGIDATGREKDAPFQTLRDLSVSPAALRDLFSVRAASDQMYSFTFNDLSSDSIKPFSGTDLQEHSFYVAHQDLFNISQRVSIIFNFMLNSGAQKDIINNNVKNWFVWEYFNDAYGDWVKLGETVDEQNGTSQFFNSGHMEVKKTYFGEIPETIVNGVKNRWIRCRSLKPLTAAAPKTLPEITTLKISVKSKEIEPEMAFNNNAPLDIGIKSLRLMGIKIEGLWLVSPFEKVGDTHKAEITFPSTNPIRKKDRVRFDNGSEWEVVSSGILEEKSPIRIELILIGLHVGQKLPEPGSALHLVTAIRENDVDSVISVAVDEETDLPESRFICFDLQEDGSKQPEFYKFKIDNEHTDDKRACFKLSIEKNDVIIPSLCEGKSVYLIPHIKPFGEVPFTGDKFYLACDEAFTKKNAAIAIKFVYALNGVPESSAKKQIQSTYSVFPTLIWEYWNGKTKTWRRLGTVDTTGNFTNVSVGLPGNNRSNWNTGDIRFTCPEDIAKVKVNGEEKYWIRAKIIEGDYGKKIKLINEKIKIQKGINPDSEEEFYFVTSQLLDVHYPIINNIKITYVSSPEFPVCCYSYNNNDYVDVTEQVIAGNRPFFPFEELPERTDTLFFGFDKQLKGGPLRLYFRLKEEFSDLQTAQSEWSFWNGSAWEKLTVDDTTGGFRMNGYVEFFGSQQFTQSSHFDRQRYWLKVSIPGGSFPDGLEFDGIFFNAVEAIQSSLIEDEQLGASDGTQNQKFNTVNSPVIDQEVWVREPSRPNDAAVKKILTDEPGPSIIEETEKGPWKGEYWIRWHCVEDFDSTGPDDRHCKVDRRTGTVSFGDGASGMVPPKGGANIAISYRFGGGVAGNVYPGAITSVKSSIPYINSVTNPFMADGGAEAEQQKNALERSSQSLQHRNRAVTSSDFERIVLFSRSVARAHCLSNINSDGEPEPGWISMLVIPETRVRPPVASLQLISNVKKILEEASTGTVAVNKRLSVRSPVFVTIRVEAILVPGNPDNAAGIVNEAESVLEQFFDPINGGSNKKGFEFGGLVCLSAVTSILENIKDVDHVYECKLYADNVLCEGDFPLPDNSVTVSGVHTIDLILYSDTVPISGLAKSECECD